ncbi:unnamed protein product, partial [Musa hybrid cultivar]
MTRNVIDSSTDHSFHVKSVDTIQMEVYCNKQRVVFPCYALLLRVEEERERREERGCFGWWHTINACLCG